MAKIISVFNNKGGVESLRSAGISGTHWGTSD
jgi:hypothetical protein